MDRAYEGDKTRELCQSFGHKPVVPPKKNRINPWEYDHELYKRRNIIERLFRWLKAFRRVCTRYDKLDVIFLSFVQIACIFTWLKQCQQALEAYFDENPPKDVPDAVRKIKENFGIPITATPVRYQLKAKAIRTKSQKAYLQKQT